MQKVKWFLVANQEVSFGNVDMIQNCFAPFDRKMFGKSEEQLTSTDCWPTVGRQLADSQWRWAVLRFYQMFNVQTVNCMQYSQLVVIQESNSVAIMQWNEYKLRTLISKTQWFTLIEEKLFGP